jgi:hypothetical protein
VTPKPGDRRNVSGLDSGHSLAMPPLFPGHWRRLELLAFEAHDLALAKLERNFERDRDDVKRLAAGGFLDRDTLIQRYHSEVRP